MVAQKRKCLWAVDMSEIISRFFGSAGHLDSNGLPENGWTPELLEQAAHILAGK